MLRRRMSPDSLCGLIADLIADFFFLSRPSLYDIILFLLYTRCNVKDWIFSISFILRLS